MLVGNIIYSNNSEPQDISPEDVGKLAIIKGSYKDLFYCGTDKDYTIVFQDTGSTLAWKNENELQFVEDGGEHLLEEVEVTYKALIESHRDLKSIVEKWPELKSSESILFLFEKIEFKPKFLKNGEYFSLYFDWELLFPIFDFLMTSDKFEDLTKFGLYPDINQVPFENLFNEIKELQK